MNNENGFIVLHRQIVNWKYYQSDSGFRLWIHILLRANWKDGYFKGKLIPRGSLATSLPSLSSETGLSESTVRRWLKRLENDGQIVNEVNSRFRVIKVVNYNAFQSISEDRVNSQVNSLMNSQVNSLMNSQVNSLVTPDRTKKQSNKETNIKESVKRKENETFSPPTLADIESFVSENDLVVDPKYFFDYYESAGWKSDWKARLRRWDKEDREKQSQPPKQQSAAVVPMPSYMQKQKEEMMQQKSKESEDEFWWMKEN